MHSATEHSGRVCRKCWASERSHEPCDVCACAIHSGTSAALAAHLMYLMADVGSIAQLPFLVNSLSDICLQTVHRRRVSCHQQCTISRPLSSMATWCHHHTCGQANTRLAGLLRVCTFFYVPMCHVNKLVLSICRLSSSAVLTCHYRPNASKHSANLQCTRNAPVVWVGLPTQ